VSQLPIAGFGLNQGQKTAVHDLNLFLGNPSPAASIFSICGAAGTGKTTLLKYAATALGENAMICAPTQKACGVLAHVLAGMGLPKVRTLSSVLDHWTPVPVSRPPTALEVAYFHSIGEPAPASIDTVEFDRDDGEQPFSVILIDEASMVSLEDFNRLSAKGTKSIFVGDGSQLPSVGTDGFFQTYPHDVTLTQNMRQGGGGEILTLCNEIRAGDSTGLYDGSRWTSGDVVISRLPPVANFAKAGMILAHSNGECDRLNAAVRKVLGVIDPAQPQRPMIGAKLLSWATDREFGIVNSAAYTVLTDGAPILRRGGQAVVGYRCHLADRHGRRLERAVPVPNVKLLAQKTEAALCDRATVAMSFGHAITGHKSQADEAATVAVVMPGYSFADIEKWLYTVVSRARQQLFIAHRWRP
jgi:hypothetical protein